MKVSDSLIVLLMTALLGICISLYYLGHHHQMMNNWGLRLKGGSAYAASSFIGFSISYLLKILWNERAILGELFAPSSGRLILCAVIAFVTPVGNLLWFPLPFGVILMLQLKQGLPDPSILATGFPLVAAAYAVACLTAVHTHSFWRMVLPMLVFLTGTFAAVTLFFGVGYF